MEKFEKIRKPEIPTGRGREVAENLHGWLLLFEKVKNKVVKVNKALTTERELNKMNSRKTESFLYNNYRVVDKINY